MRATLIHRSGIDWTDYSLNTYVGCQHGCQYCYGMLNVARRFKHLMPSSGVWTDPDYIVNAPELAAKEVRRIKPPATILVCSLCDPYQPIEAELGITRKTLEALFANMEPGVRVLILTKSDLVRADLGLLEEHSDKVELGMTVISLMANRYEPRASRPISRLHVLEEAHRRGIRTFISIEPWIPGITDPVKIMKATRRYVDWYILGKLNYLHVPPEFYKRHMPRVMEFVESEGIKVFIKKELRRVVGYGGAT